MRHRGEAQVRFWCLAIKKLGAPTCSAGGSGFKHISVLPFISLDGKISEPYITMAGSSTMNVWKEVWPQAHVAVSEKGAVTTDLFSQRLCKNYFWVSKTGF